jgi:glyceraldehyde 3-phosphate dehydrogenase
VAVDGDSMVVNGDRIKVLAERNPAKLPWGAARRRRRARVHRPLHQQGQGGAHLKGGAKKVIISAPGGKDVDATVVYGVNHGVLKACAHGDLERLLHHQLPGAAGQGAARQIGIVHGLMTTIHAYTNDQVLTDVYHTDLRRARSATMSMIPTKTGAAAAVGLVLPELNGKLDGFAMRVPTINVSVVDLTFTPRATTTSKRSTRIEGCFEGALKGILGLQSRAAGLDRLQPRSAQLGL